MKKLLLFCLLIIIIPIKGSDISQAEQSSTVTTLNPWALSMTQLDQAQQITEGEGIVIGLLDGGIATDIFSGNLWINNDEIPDNGLDDDNNGYIDDIHGFNFYSNSNDTNDWSTISHGSTVASILRESAPKAKIMSLKVIASNNIIANNDVSGISEALLYAKDNGVNIIYMPFRLSSTPTYLLDRFSELYSHNITLVASAGQDTISGPLGFIYSPAREISVIAVSAVDNQEKIYSKGNYGKEIELATPGVHLTATDKNNNTIDVTGTSFSGGFVVGTIALMLHQNPKLTPSTIRNIFYSTSKDINIRGIDDYSGAGLLQSYAAVQTATDNLAPIIVDERFLTDFNPDSPSIKMNFTFYEESGIISCSYRYQIKNREWALKNQCANYENRLIPSDNKITVSLKIEELTSEINIAINLTDFTGKTTFYSKGPIFTGLADPAVSTVVISDNSSSTIITEDSDQTSPNPSISTYSGKAFSDTSTHSVLFSNLFIFIFPIIAISRRKK